MTLDALIRTHLFFAEAFRLVTAIAYTIIVDTIAFLKASDENVVIGDNEGCRNDEDEELNLEQMRRRSEHIVASDPTDLRIAVVSR